MKSTKTISFLFVLASAITACIPTGTTTTNAFAINLHADRESFTEKDTTIVLDGDSLTFYVKCFNFFENIDYFIIATNSTAYEYLKVQTYFWDINTNAIDSTSILTDVNAIESGIVINNSYNAYPWVPFVLNNNQYICLSLPYRTSPSNPMIVNGLKKNTDQFLVLRKLKGTKYQYYWIKVRNNEIVGSINTIKILNGRYQLNSITTGQ